MIQRAWTGGVFVSACTATGALFLAMIVRATVRDTKHTFSLLFYATPWPLLVVLSALLSWYWAHRRQRALSFGLALTAMIALGFWFRQSWHWGPLSGGRGSLRVVQWNVDRPDWRLPGDARWLLEQDADLMAIAERQPRKKDTSQRWRAAFPAYQFVPSDGEMLCLVRGEVLSVKDGLLDDGSWATLIRTRIREREVTMLQVDISASPFANREKPLRRLAEIIGNHRHEHLVIAGDFNTPLESAFFSAFRAQISNAFESVGRGCSATWPRPVPVLSLDQIWSSAGLRAVRCEHFGSWRSDHRAVVADFDFSK